MKLLSELLIILSDGTRAVIDLCVTGTFNKDGLLWELNLLINKLVAFRSNNFVR